MLIFFTIVIKFLYNFVHISVTDFLKVINYFDKTIIDLTTYRMFNDKLNFLSDNVKGIKASEKRLKLFENLETKSLLQGLCFSQKHTPW